MGRESLYYIMDYSGNYYRTDQADQLVAVASEQDATVFTFTQANSRICVGKKASFYCMVPIEEQRDGTEETESDYLQDDTEVEADAVAEIEGAESEEYVSPVKELTFGEVTEPTEKSASTYDLSEMDWEEYLTHFTYLVDGIKDYRDELTRRHSDIDQKICDILHYIEFCETNDNEAIDLIELLRVCRENRREIKDELQRIEYFQKNLGTNANGAKAKLALKSVKGLETRKYKPRKYDELFENCVLKGKRLQRADIQEEYREETRKYQFESEHRYEDEGGEKNMALERRYTPFDGKENDWLSFARQQAEFYRNAGDYINNLQMDIAEIDEEIEDILQETEEANCNVTQGYKVFKRLKELRLEKKSKTKELECLYILTDYIDCNTLADTCEANLSEVESVMGIPEQKAITSIQSVDVAEEVHVAEQIADMVG